VTKGDTAKTVAIVGAGIGGVYLLAELGSTGFKLRLHDIDGSKLAEIRAHGGLDVGGERALRVPQPTRRAPCEHLEQRVFGIG
jgi:2-polyprenyl-6-methoxyphenol hydroxylase-like FAD-dependent oxidoreductase